MDNAHPVSRIIKERLRRKRVRFRANDNIADYINPGELIELEREVAGKVQGVLDSLVIDTENDHNTRDTAKRVAKMFCREIYHGRFTPAPTITDFPNVSNLDEMMVTGPISIRSTCSHHMCPIIGRAWVGILPGKRVIGLSKFNRIVDWLCSRPQIQEEMVVQVADELERLTKPKGLAVVISATHTCMTWRGVRESDTAEMVNSVMRGRFKQNVATRAEFFSLIHK